MFDRELARRFPLDAFQLRSPPEVIAKAVELGLLSERSAGVFEITEAGWKDGWRGYVKHRYNPFN